jgi:hypothetical protein
LLTTDAPGLARPCLLQSSRSDIWNMVRNVYRVLSHSHVVMGIATPTKEASATTYPTMKSILNLVYLIFVYRNVMYIACIQLLCIGKLYVMDFRPRKNIHIGRNLTNLS